MNTHDIVRIITKSHPELIKLICRVDPVEPLFPRDISVLDAISHIVIGQMLSRKASQSIANKALKLSTEKKLPGIAYLSDTDLTNCGLSQKKIKTIHLFAEYYHKNKSEIENWRSLNSFNLYHEVGLHWGLSNWSASMLGIFYFGLEDIFPFEDGSIKRAIKSLESVNIQIFPQLAAPYRSYLALYLWKFLDKNLLDI
jgi:DNA-3-methyladenine glycosylase II